MRSIEEFTTSGILLSSVELRDRPGPHEASAERRRKGATYVLLAGPSGETFYPTFFADAKYDRPVLEKVSKALGGLSGGSKWEFFTTPKISLGNKTPLDALAKGKIDQVLVAAAGFLEE